MPIFTKNTRRVYFAHIPKTAGSAICLAFLRSGWSIANVDTRNRPGRLGAVLAQEAGITEIPFEGSRDGLDTDAQHAPHHVWRGWGPFEASFAIVRHPADRYLSALRYKYSRRRRLLSFARFRRQVARDLLTSLDKDGVPRPRFFRPQIDYLGPQTEVFVYEDNWPAALARRFELEPGSLDRINIGQVPAPALLPSEAALVLGLYGSDFRRLGYPETDLRIAA